MVEKNLSFIQAKEIHEQPSFVNALKLNNRFSVLNSQSLKQTEKNYPPLSLSNLNGRARANVKYWQIVYAIGKISSTRYIQLKGKSWTRRELQETQYHHLVQIIRTSIFICMQLLKLRKSKTF